MARDQSWFAERDTVLTALSRREVQWAAQHPSAYRFRATWATMGEASHVDVVAVAGRPLVICDTLGMPADSETRAVVGLDVPALFESIREALADTTHNVMVQFDPARGFPTYLEIGNRWTSDVGYIRRVEHFRVIDQSQAQCARIKRDAAADAQSYVPLH